MFDFFGLVPGLIKVGSRVLNLARRGVSIDVLTTSLNGQPVPRRGGDDALVFEVIVAESLGRPTHVLRLRVDVENHESTSNCEYREPAKQSSPLHPPFNLGPKEARRLTVIAHFIKKLPSSGKAVVVAEVPGHRDGRATLQLPTP